MPKHAGIVEVKVSGQSLYLTPQRALYWPDARLLFAADVHVGKAAHFRRNGIPLHHRVQQQNHFNLSGLIQQFEPDGIVFLGDLSHSAINNEWHAFIDVLDNFPRVKRVLIRGNHDMLPNEEYEKADFEVKDEMARGPFLFSHDRVSTALYNINAHLHPAVHMAGAAGQSLRLPCFWFTKEFAVLPAFGSFTGMRAIKPKTGDRLFAVADDAVWDLSQKTDSL